MTDQTQTVPTETPATQAPEVSGDKTKAPRKQAASKVSEPKSQSGDKAPAKTAAKAKTDAAPDYGQYREHPAAAMFPLMTGQAFKELVEDIRKNGQLDPVYVHEGMIVDGRNRYRAAVAAGRKPKTKPLPLDLDAEDAPTIAAWIVSKNLQRRHLTTGQRAMLAAKLAEEEAKEIKAREAARKAAQPRGADGRLTETGAEKPSTADRHAREATERAGKEVGVSGRAVARAQRVRKEAPDLATKVETGEMSLNAAEGQVKGPESVVSQADKLITSLWGVVRAVQSDPMLLEAFDWALQEDPTLRESLTELLKIKS